MPKVRLTSDQVQMIIIDSVTSRTEGGTRYKAIDMEINIDASQIIHEPTNGEMGWRGIDSAPKDDCIFGFDPKNHYSGKVMFLDGEWECIDWKGYRMKIGFYPVYWIHIPSPPTNRNEEEG